MGRSPTAVIPTLQVVLAAILAGATAGMVHAVILMLTLPLGPGGSPLAILLLAAVGGAVVGGPFALLCGGLVRLIMRSVGRPEILPHVFAAAGLVAGLLFAAMLFGRSLTPGMAASGSICGLAGALVFRSVMPALSHPEEP